MLSWRDLKNPYMGGAEVFTHEVLKRLAKYGYRVIHFSPVFEGAARKEKIDGIYYLRQGNVFSVILHAMVFYKKNRKSIDLVIDQCNTHHFFTPLWVEKEKRAFLIFQLCRELWSVMMPGLIGKIGYLLELPLLRLNKHDLTFTESESVRQELIQIGFDKDKVHIIPIGLNFKPWNPECFFPKEENPTFIYVGRYARYKGINDLITAFGMLKQDYPQAKLWIVGKKDEKYIHDILEPLWEKYNLIAGDQEQDDIRLWGFLEEEKKKELQSRAHALVFPSLREGWGMIVTEAAAVGTPSIVYNCTGGIDAIDYGRAGYLCRENTPEELCRIMKESIEDREKYSRLRINAYKFSMKFSWNTSSDIIDEILKSDKKIEGKEIQYLSGNKYCTK